MTPFLPLKEIRWIERSIIDYLMVQHPGQIVPDLTGEGGAGLGSIQ
jgi:hypothetical protein